MPDILTKMSSMRPSSLMNELAVCADKLDAIEILAPESYEVAYSPRRVGQEKVSGGNPSDATGERASCNCEDRDEDHGTIIHVCSSTRYNKAVSEIIVARIALTRALDRFSSIVKGSDHHPAPMPSESADRQQGKTYPVDGESDPSEWCFRCKDGICTDHPKRGRRRRRAPEAVEEDHNPQASRARILKAHKLAEAAHESYRRKLTLAGFDPKQAEELASRCVRPSAIKALAS